jgi:iron complex transport system permease protein
VRLREKEDIASVEGVKRRSRKLPYPVIVSLLGIILVVVVVLSFMIGRYPIQPQELLGIFISRIMHTDQPWVSQAQMVLFNVRMPRIALACLVGCCLSAAGAGYQGIFQNPMASPDILGAVQGAAFGAAIAIFFGLGSYLVTVSAFCFGLVTIVLVFLISQRVRADRLLSLILSGIMIASLFSAATSFIKMVADPQNQLPAITYWLMGSLSGATFDEIIFVFFPMALGLVPLFLLRWRVNILTLGDDEARTMGVNPTWIRMVVILSATLATAAAISVCGMIGWVGLVIPHLSRRLVGNNYKYLMPATMLLGAIFLLLVDDVSRNLLQTEIPIGVLTAFVGAPFFIYLITRREVF